MDFLTNPPLGRVIDQGLLRAVVKAAMRRTPRDSGAWLGPRLHGTLWLTRREAADKRIWQFLTVVAFPEYVRWRW